MLWWFGCHIVRIMIGDYVLRNSYSFEVCEARVLSHVLYPLCANDTQKRSDAADGAAVVVSVADIMVCDVCVSVPNE